MKTKKLTFATVLCLLLITSSALKAQFYVSPTGNDNNPGTLASPFLTLEKAQTAMRGSSTKTTYLRGGTYNRTATLNLGSADNGQSWLGYPGQNPIINGQNSVATAINISGGKNIAIRWLTIQNFKENGIIAGNVDGILIDSDTIRHITSPNWSMGAVRYTGSGVFTNVKITHNYIQDLGYNGISIHAFPGNDISNLVIEYNIVYDYMKQKADGGGIYVMDRGHSGKPVRIANNIVGNYGIPQTGGKHIYLDDMMSNATVENNICFGACQWAVQYHGGDHNIIRNNIFDITLAGKLGLYQDNTSNGDYGMKGNSFTCNIVYSSGKVPSQLWDCWKAATDSLPYVSGNDYWNTNGNTMPNAGSVVDKNPLKINPGFVNAANHDYRFSSSSPMACFKPIDRSAVGPLPNGISTAIPLVGLLDNNFQIYPNPASESITLNYQLTESNAIKISIYDLLGKEIIQVANEKQSAGEHRLNINTETLQSGIYFVKMNVNGEQVTQKLIVRNNTNS